MKHILMMLSLLAVVAFFVGCGGNACEDLAEELCDKICSECGEDHATCKACSEPAEETEDGDAECTESMETAAQDLVDNFSTDTYCPDAGDDDDDG